MTVDRSAGYRHDEGDARAARMGCCIVRVVARGRRRCRCSEERACRRLHQGTTGVRSGNKQELEPSRACTCKVLPAAGLLFSIGAPAHGPPPAGALRDQPMCVCDGARVRAPRPARSCCLPTAHARRKTEQQASSTADLLRLPPDGKNPPWQHLLVLARHVCSWLPVSIADFLTGALGSAAPRCVRDGVPSRRPPDAHAHAHAHDTHIYKYTCGRAGEHNVVLACLPGGEPVTHPTATVAVQMELAFTSTRFGTTVGIGGGVPSEEADIRLGDVVVGKPHKTHGGGVMHPARQAHEGTA